tara:strand:- start:3702 stop:3962 length:261 start_codon:yes stop_codon:yes gene_type:complete
MKAIGNNIIIKTEKQTTKKTKSGLILGEKQREDIRYNKAIIISLGSEVKGLKVADAIFYDKVQGHKFEFNDEFYKVIKYQDVVVLL